MNPSEREEETFIILYDYQEERQAGNYYTIPMYKRVTKKEDILKDIIELSKNRRIKAFQIFVLGKQLSVKWE